MGNFLQRLFSSDSNSREPGKRSRSHKLNLNDSKSKSQVDPATDGSQTEPVLFRRSFKTPSVPHMHSVTLTERSIDSLQSISQESHSGAHAHHTQAPSEVAKPEDNVVQSDLAQPEPQDSPFHRDYLPAHQPLVSLEKSRPRRSNIRRSSRMNTSTGKGDNVVRPAITKKLTTVPSYIEPDYDLDESASSPPLPALAAHSHSSQNGTNWSHDDAETSHKQTHSDTEQEDEAKRNNNNNNDDTVDEMAPTERVKVAKSRISQMFIKREQKKHTSVLETDGHVNTATPVGNNGLMLNTDYVRVYDNIDNYGHYSVADRITGDEQHPHQPNHSNHKHSPGSVESLDSVEEESNSKHHDRPESGGDQPDESSRPEVVVPRRIKPKMLGNPMLIDELKKRQSALPQVTERD